MSDDKLFQNTDAQESAYAPSGPDPERPDSGTDHGLLGDAPGAGVIVPAAGLAAIGGMGAGGTVGPTATGAVGPALAGVALAGAAADNDDNRDVPEGVNDADDQTPNG